ncbi:MAG: hypothetical protein K6C96_08960 [Butyrivibrio sp.]|nr:hypothetical protein [Butyrivibrio sp.]
MGARNLTIVVVDNEIKVAQYGQYGGYPEANGLAVKRFIGKIAEHSDEISKFRNACRNCRFITDDELNEKYKEAGIDPEDESGMTLRQLNTFEAMYPALKKDASAEVLQLILDNGGCELWDAIEFAADSFLCEWACLINLDTESVEIYKGFNREPLAKDDRFYMYMDRFLTTSEGLDHLYFPIRKILEIPFKELSEMSDDKFLEMFTGNDD